MFKTYRKRAVDVQAAQFTGYNSDEILAFIREHGGKAEFIYGGLPVEQQVLTVETPSGYVNARFGDWIVFSPPIEGQPADFYPVKSLTFSMNFSDVLSDPEGVDKLAESESANLHQLTSDKPLLVPLGEEQKEASEAK